MVTASALKKMKDHQADHSVSASEDFDAFAGLRNHYGHTWPEHEAYLRARLRGLATVDVEREISIQKRQFALTAARAPAFELSKKLVKAAYEATPPTDQAKFLESLRNNRG